MKKKIIITFCAGCGASGVFTQPQEKIRGAVVKRAGFQGRPAWSVEEPGWKNVQMPESGCMNGQNWQG